MAESVGGKEWSLEIGPLYVVRVERVRGEDGVAMVAVSLADARYFWPRGYLQKWSYNRVQADGDYAGNSVKSDGKPYTMREIAAYALSRLPRSPELARAPEAWGLKQGPREFAPFSPPLDALAELCREGGVEAPILRLDGSVGLYAPGEGYTGTAGAPGEENSDLFPEGLRLSKGLTGQRYVIEPKHPDDFLIVRGGKRIETVSLDDWEPVLEIKGRFYALTAELLTELTGGRFKDPLKWLHKFLVVPPAYQNAVSIPESVSNLLRTQAYRLFRLPGAVIEADRKKPGKETPAPAPAPRDPLPASSPGSSRERRRDDLADQARDFAQAVRASGQAAEEDAGREDHRPGPNSHLLPLLDRAETQAGKRLPPTIERNGFTTTHRTFDGPGADQSAKLSGLAAAMSSIRRAIENQRIQSLSFENPLGSVAQRSSERLDFSGVPGLFEGLDELLGGAGKSDMIDDLKKQIRQARQVQDLAKVDPALAGDYEGKYTEMLGLGDEVNGTTDSELYGVAKELLGFEQRLRDENYELESPLGYLSGLSDLAKDPKFKGPLDALKAKVAESLRAAAKKREKVQRIKEAGGSPAALLEARVAHFTKNLVYQLPDEDDPAQAPDQARVAELEKLRKEKNFGGFLDQIKFNRRQGLERFVDEGARVYSAAAGVIQTSELAGVLDRDGLPTPAASFFVPQPVRVTFGATVRPFAGESQAIAGAPIKSATGRAKPGDVKIEGALEDGPTYYTRAYKRGAGGRSELIKLEQIPTGEGTVLVREDMIELVPLIGTGNRAALDRTANEIAAARFSTPEKVESGTYTLARPLQVNCDGIVSAVQWSSRPDGAGFETRVDVGGEVKLNPFQPATRVRRRPRANPDNADREGLNA
jgi:hypothetical protein